MVMSQFTIKRYGRFWAVYDGDQLVAVVVYRVGAREIVRRHTTEEAAVLTMEKMVADAEKLGWIRKQRSSGFKAKPDAFDVAHLPTPVVTKGTSKK